MQIMWVSRVHLHRVWKKVTWQVLKTDRIRFELNLNPSTPLVNLTHFDQSQPVCHPYQWRSCNQASQGLISYAFAIISSSSFFFLWIKIKHPPSSMHQLNLIISSSSSSRLMNASEIIMKDLILWTIDNDRLTKSGMKQWWTLANGWWSPAKILIVQDIKRDQGLYFVR